MCRHLPTPRPRPRGPGPCPCPKFGPRHGPSTGPRYPPPAYRAPAPTAAHYLAPPQPPFLGQPIASLVVGTDIGNDIPGGRPCVCAIATAFTGHAHRPFECPIRLHATFGRCPGWTAAGACIPASWNGKNFTPACRAEWRAFAPTLPVSNIARGASVNF